MIKFLLIMSPFIITGVVFLWHYVYDKLTKYQRLYREWDVTSCDFIASLDEMKTYHSVAPDKYVLHKVHMFRMVDGRIIRIKPNRDELENYIAWKSECDKENDDKAAKKKDRAMTKAKLEYLQTVVQEDIDNCRAESLRYIDEARTMSRMASESLSANHSANSTNDSVSHSLRSYFSAD